MSGGTSDRPGRRETAHRVFAAEYENATYSYAESDEERAPNYVVSPTGARMNRVFVAGVLTAVEAAGESNLRARVVDPTGAFVVYAGQYEPEAMSTLERLDTPSYVAVTGKARTFESRDGERTFSTVRPEAVSEVDAGTRDRWVVDTALHTLSRVETFRSALDRPERGEDLRRALLAADVAPALAAGIPRALAAYGTTPAYLAAVQGLALEAARVVAGELEEVSGLSVSPGDVDPDRSPRPIAQSAIESIVTGGGLPADGDLADEASVTETATVAADARAGQPSDAESADRTVDAPVADPVEDSGSEPVTSSDAQTEHDTESAGADESPADGEDIEAIDSDELYEIDDAERESLEAEFDMEFASGDEIPAAGEADIEPEAAQDDAGESDDETEAETPDAADTSEDDLEDVVVVRMRELADTGDGTASRDRLIETVTSERGVDDAAVEEAIQDALMSGRCYESGDGELTPI